MSSVFDYVKNNRNFWSRAVIFLCFLSTILSFIVYSFCIAQQMVNRKLFNRKSFHLLRAINNPPTIQASSKILTASKGRIYPYLSPDSSACPMVLIVISIGSGLLTDTKRWLRVMNNTIMAPTMVVPSPAMNLLRYNFSARSPSPLVNKIENT